VCGQPSLSAVLRSALNADIEQPASAGRSGAWVNLEVRAQAIAGSALILVSASAKASRQGQRAGR
jgi:hypothetical protein